ncbi:Membrane magnesium transporter-like protein [Drosera capensis]
MVTPGFSVGLLGVLVLFHAAFSTIQYRGVLKITEEEFSGPPLNVVLELVVGFVLCMYAGLTVPGKFKSIHPDSEENRLCFCIDIEVFRVVLAIHGCVASGGLIILAVESSFFSVGPLGFHVREQGWIVSLPANLDYMIFNHRGRVMFPDTVETK